MKRLAQSFLYRSSLPGRPSVVAPVVLIVFLLLSACTVPATPDPTALPPTPTTDPLPALLETAAAHLASGARTAAEAACQEAAALRPSDPAPYLCLSRLYLDWNRLEEGLAAASEAERAGASDAEVGSLRAAFYAQMNDWAVVITHGRAALALDPAGSEARHLVARAYIALGYVDEARAEYQSLLQADPNDVAAREGFGVLLALADPMAAVSHLQAAETPLAQELLDVLSEGGDDPAYRLTMIGQVCLAYDEPALAAVALGRAAVHNPAYADAQALLGQALGQLGRPGEALVHLETAVDLAPTSALARSLLGVHYLQSGDFSAARPHLEAAYDLDPENPAFSLYLAYLYADMGLFEVARVWLEEAARLVPEDPVVWEAVVRFYLNRGLVAGEGSDAAVSTSLLEAAHALAQLAPESGTAYDLLGWTEFLAGRYVSAETYLREAVAREPTLASAHYHLGQVTAYLGRVEEARAALMLAADLNTDPSLRVEIERSLAALP